MKHKGVLSTVLGPFSQNLAMICNSFCLEGKKGQRNKDEYQRKQYFEICLEDNVAQDYSTKVEGIVD